MTPGRGPHERPPAHSDVQKSLPQSLPLFSSPFSLRTEVCCGELIGQLATNHSHRGVAGDERSSKPRPARRVAALSAAGEAMLAPFPPSLRSLRTLSRAKEGSAPPPASLPWALLGFRSSKARALSLPRCQIQAGQPAFHPPCKEQTDGRNSPLGFSLPRAFEGAGVLRKPFGCPARGKGRGGATPV